MKEDIFYNSRDGKTKIHGVIWKPACMLQGRRPKAVLQIVHGMQEHIERYDAFAQYLNAQDICVIGNDHLGHGQSVLSEKEYGYFGEGDIATVVVRDVHRLKKIVQEQNPGVPFFLMGHSMGSFIARNYIARYGTGIQGAIIMGTGSQPGFVLGFGKGLTGLIGLCKGRYYKSRFIGNMAMGGYLKRIPHPETASDWLSVNKENVQAFIENPLDGKPFSVNGFRTLFEFISRCQSSAYIRQVPKNLPLFFVAGEEDPVGNYGKGVKQAYESYRKAGIQDMTIKLYKGMRHEILNEDDREEVYRDLLGWLEARIK